MTLRLERPLLAPGLYIVSTPIGNLKDITLRALEVLMGAARIYCEDTRVSGKLMSHFGLRTPLATYHEHNAAERRPQIMAALAAGEAVALISDAGTPLISDPGYKLVADVAHAGFAVVPVPGASALLAGLVAAGLPTDRVLFCGFPPSRQKARNDFYRDVAGIEASLVFYESPRRMAESLAAMAEVFGPEREAALGREITKRFESFYRGTLGDLAATPELFPEKGEFVVVIAPPLEEVMAADALDGALQAALSDMPLSRAAAHVAKKLGLPRREVYQRALDMQGADRGKGDG